MYIVKVNIPSVTNKRFVLSSEPDDSLPIRQGRTVSNEREIQQKQIINFNRNDKEKSGTVATHQFPWQKRNKTSKWVHY